MLDGFLSGHDSVEKVLPSGTLFARNLPHQSRIHVTNNLERIIPNVKDARRRPRRHSQKDRLLRVCDVGNQSLRSVSGARTLGALSIGSTSGSLHQAEAHARNPCRTNPFVAPRRRFLSKQRMLRRISNLCHCVAQQLFWNR